MDSHIFSSTFSHLGYDMEDVFSSDHFKEIQQEKLKLQYHWDLKPGHYIDFRNAIFDKKDPIFSKDSTEERIMPGIDMMQLIVEKTFEEHKQDFDKLFNCREIKPYLRKQRINIVFNEHGLKEEKQTNDEHPELVKHLKKCAFSKTDLKNLRQDLNACRASKVLKERTLKMFETFNDCTMDPLFFNYFIELKEYLNGIKIKVHKYLEKPDRDATLEDFHTWLDKMIRSFEQAYHNRFHQSSRMRNISDFNLEYNGGIQQLISAYDMAYKTILKSLIKQDSKENCVYVSGYERVSSDRNSLCINIFHITYPELYASTIWKEAMNFYWIVLPDEEREKITRINIRENSELLLKPGSVGLLKHQIQSHKKFDHSSYVHRLMLASMNESFIHYLLADAAVFNIGYFGDFELFTHWYWTYFSQMSHFYNREGEMEPDVFIKFFCRWVFIKRFYRVNESKDIDYQIFDSKLTELQFCYTQEVYTFIDILLQELEKKDFLGFAQGMAGQYAFTYLNLPSSDSPIEQELSEEDKKVIEEKVSFLGQYFDSQQKFFEQGNIICFADKEDDEFHIKTLLLSYLRRIKGLSIHKEHSIKTLERNSKGEIEWRQQYNPIVSDPLGGMFMCNKEVRGQYYQSRSVFYKSLWGISLKIKKQYVTKITKACI